MVGWCEVQLPHLSCRDEGDHQWSGGQDAQYQNSPTPSRGLTQGSPSFLEPIGAQNCLKITLTKLKKKCDFLVICVVIACEKMSFSSTCMSSRNHYYGLPFSSNISSPFPNCQCTSIVYIRQVAALALRPRLGLIVNILWIYPSNAVLISES